MGTRARVKVFSSFVLPHDDGIEDKDEQWKRRPRRRVLGKPRVTKGKQDTEVDKEHKKRTSNTTFADNPSFNDSVINFCLTPTLLDSFDTSRTLSYTGFEKRNHTPVNADVPDDSSQLSTEIEYHPFEYHPFDLKVTGFPEAAEAEGLQSSPKKQLPQSERKGDDSLHSNELIHISLLQTHNMVIHEKESTHYVSSETKSVCFNNEQTKLESYDPVEEDRTEQTILTGVNLSEKMVLPSRKLRDHVERVDPMKGSSPENETRLANRLHTNRLHTDTLHCSSVSLKMKQPHDSDPNRADHLSEIQKHEPVPQEFDRLRRLHSAVALKPDFEFPVDLGKTQSLPLIQAAAVEVLVAFGQMISPYEQTYWEIWRLGTFSEVDDLVVFAIRLAQSGFFYDTSRDVITCFSCHLKKRHWERSEKPSIAHLLLSPECQHANFKEERNVPVSPSYPLLPSSEQSQRCGDNSEEIMQDGESSACPSLQASTGRSPAPGVDATQTTGAATLAASDGSPPDAGSRPPPVTDQERHVSTGTTENYQRSTSSSNGSGSAAAPQAPPSDSVLAQNTGNVPPQQNPSSTSSAEDRGRQSSDSEHESGGYAWTQSTLDMRCAASPSNASASTRFKSFLNWPEDGLPSSRCLVLAGFYYLGVSDSVRCFYCGITLRQWQQNDDPWKLHVQFRFSCDYVRAIKGEDFVRDTLVQAARRRQSRSTSTGDEPSAGGRTAETLSTDPPAGSASSAPAESPTTASTLTTTSTSASVTDPASSNRNQVSADTPQNAPDQPSQPEGVGRSSGADGLSNAEPPSVPVLSKHNGTGTEITERKNGPGLVFAAAEVDSFGVQSQSIVVGFAQEARDAGNQGGGQGSATGDSAGTQLTVDGTGINTQTNDGNATNQDGLNGTGTSHHRRVSSTNQSRTSAESSTPAESSHSQSDSLQSDSEPPALSQTATPSATSSTTTRQSVPRGPATAASRTSAGREGPAPSRTSRVTNADNDQREYLQQLQEANQRLRQGRSCRVCSVRDVDTIFMPCGHLCTCGSCATTIHFCCLCNSRIRATALVYLE